MCSFCQEQIYSDAHVQSLLCNVSMLHSITKLHANCKRCWSPMAGRKAQNISEQADKTWIHMSKEFVLYPDFVKQVISPLHSAEASSFL